MDLVRDGDARAFEAIVERHGDAAFSLAYRMLHERSTAEEVVQEAFLSLWRTGAGYDRSRGTVRAWVLGAVHNRAIDRFRREATHVGRYVRDERAVQRLPAAQNTEREVCARDDARQVRGALQALPAEQRQVIELAYFSGFSQSQIAERLTLPAGTVKGRMRLGLGKLALALVRLAEA